MKIFVDFDNTIFDTRHKFLNNFFDVFENYGVSRKLFNGTLPHFSKTSLQKGECYSPKRHIEIIKNDFNKKINEEVFLREMEVFLENLEEYVFEDFYAFAHQFDKEDLVILSYGEYNFQKQKIEGSGVEQFFGDIIITQENKSFEIEKYMNSFNDEEIILIDDKSEYFESIKKLSIKTQTIHVAHDELKCGNDTFCDMHANNLHAIIKSLNI